MSILLHVGPLRDNVIGA